MAGACARPSRPSSCGRAAEPGPIFPLTEQGALFAAHENGLEAAWSADEREHVTRLRLAQLAKEVIIPVGANPLGLA